jgi:hypothetical protein
MLPRFVKALLSHGNRRWIVLAAPSVFIGGLQWVVNQLPFKPYAWILAMFPVKWWAWWITGLASIVIASFLAWREQVSEAESIAGRPEIIPILEGASIFLQNGNEHVAVNLSALDVVFDVDEKVAKAVSSAGLIDDIGVCKPLDQWLFGFGKISSLTKETHGFAALLPCTVYGPGGLGNMGLAYYLSQLCQSGAIVEMPLVLLFSNVGPPKRYWHAHFRLLKVPSTNLQIQHVATELSQKDGYCKACKVPAPKRPSKTLLGVLRPQVPE